MTRGSEAAVMVPAVDEGDGPRPVDLVHLAKYTMGNRELEHEVLTLFTRQSLIYLERLRSAADRKSWNEAAHTLKGSARGIGAWQVAEIAESLEDGPPSRKKGLVDDLCRSIGEANDFIEGLLTEQ